MNDDYRATFTFSASLGGEPLRVVSKRGLEDAERVPDAAALCAELLELAPDERVLLLGCGHGALGVAIGRRLPAGRLTLSDTSLIALRMAALTLEANGVPGTEVSGRLSRLPDGAGDYDRVVILAPRARALARRWLVEAHALLRVGGALTLAGANNAGVQPLIADAAALFGGARVLGYGRGCRVAEALRAEAPPEPPAWAGEPGIAPGSWHHLSLDLSGGPAELLSLPGIFSYDRLDAGTAFLLAHLTLPAGARVLDAGCGYGPIGVAAARSGAAHVDMIDVSLPAVLAAAANIERLGLRAEARASDALDAVAGRSYDLIVSNPPFHAGRQVDTAMAAAFIGQGRALLAPGGRMALVANRFLPYDRLLAPAFRRVERVAESPAYHLLVASDE
jgi:16S rRNA (guanine1207-N2)-methyltransferase